MIEMKDILRQELNESVSKIGRAMCALIISEMQEFNESIGCDENSFDEFMQLVVLHDNKIHRVIKCAFPWATSRMGGDFWSRVHETLRQIESK